MKKNVIRTQVSVAGFVPANGSMSCGHTADSNENAASPDYD